MAKFRIKLVYGLLITITIVMFLTFTYSGIKYETITSATTHKSTDIATPRHRHVYRHNTTSSTATARAETFSRNMKIRYVHDDRCDEPQPVFPGSQIAIKQRGRLGNAMFSYAALLVISCITGRQPMLSDDFQMLKKAFTVTLETYPKSHFKHFLPYSPDQCVQSYRQEYRDLNASNVNETNHKVILTGLFNNGNYFISNRETIRREFSFTKPVLDRANVFINGLNTSAVRIGIHVRGTDMNTKERLQNGYGTPPGAYYHKAMDYYRQKYTSVHFIVCTDDLKLGKMLIGGNDVTFSHETLPEVDMAILALSAHVIVGKGTTFGFWSGWLCNGTSMHYIETRDNIPKMGQYSKQRQDKYNSWIGLSV